MHTNATQTQPDVSVPGLLSSSSQPAPRVHVSSLDASWKTTNGLSAVWMQGAGQSPRAQPQKWLFVAAGKAATFPDIKSSGILFLTSFSVC